MNTELNLRVFRRNKRNIILIWNSENLSKEQCDSVAVEIEDAEKFKNVTFTSFTPHDSDKFSKKVNGVVINQVDNNLDVNRFYNIKVMFGKDANKVSRIITILPFKPTVETKEGKVVYLHAYDRDKATWQKVNGEYDEKGNFRLLIK